MRKTLLGLLIFLTPAHGRDWDFDSAAEEVESHLHAHRVAIPLAGAALWIASMAGTPLGAKDFRFAVFENARAAGEERQFNLERLTPGWRPLVRVSKRGGEHVTIMARDEDSWSHVILLTVDRKDAVLMQFKLRPGPLLDFVAAKARH